MVAAGAIQAPDGGLPNVRLLASPEVGAIGLMAGVKQHGFEHSAPQVSRMRMHKNAGIRFGQPRFSNSRHVKMRPFNTCSRSLHW